MGEGDGKRDPVLGVWGDVEEGEGEGDPALGLGVGVGDG